MQRRDQNDPLPVPGYKDMSLLQHKLETGSHITDEELQDGYEYFGKLESLLSRALPTFNLAWREAIRLHNMLLSLKRAREPSTYTKSAVVLTDEDLSKKED